MAIDTAEKRKSAAGVGFWVVGPGVTPNASRDAEWRQQAGWGYSGIAAGEAAAGGGSLIIAPWIKRRRIATKYI